MFPSLPAHVQEELASLAERLGRPIARTLDLPIGHYWSPRFGSLGASPAALRVALAKPARTAEVWLVVRRPNGRLLVSTKPFYPLGVFRLMTGGVEPGETVHAALLRETLEETGLQTEVRRFLAAFAYRSATTLAAGIDEPIFYTYAFLLDEHERISGYREIELPELPAIADSLDALANVSPDVLASQEGADPWLAPQEWWDWGRFRAPAHRAVHEALTPLPRSFAAEPGRG